jgi:hypothetical protein
MVILQATIIGLIIVAASVAARVIAATDHRLPFTAIGMEPLRNIWRMNVRFRG